MVHFSRLLPLTACLAGLAACTSDNSSSSASALSDTRLASVAANTAIPLTAHEGLEAASITNGSSVALNGAFPILSVQPSPTGTYYSLGSGGFSLVLPDGYRVDYNTAAGSTQNIGSQQFKAPVEGSSGNLVVTTLTSGALSVLSYSSYGAWMETNSIGTPLGIGVFGVGVDATSRPTSGSATYTGNVSGYVVTQNVYTNITSGTVSLFANFDTNSIAGSVTNILTSNSRVNNGQMNDITLTNGAISGNSYLGTAVAAAPVAGTTTVTVTGATGTFGGKFYGPSAAETAGSIFMSAPGGVSVMAAFGAHK